jgi:hypothetical protein
VGNKTEEEEQRERLLAAGIVGLSVLGSLALAFLPDLQKALEKRRQVEVYKRCPDCGDTRGPKLSLLQAHGSYGHEEYEQADED